MPSIVAMIPAAYKANLEAALSAVKGQTYTLIRRVTDELPPTETSTITDWLMHDASAVPEDATLYAACKLGNIPAVDQMTEQPIAWGEDGLVSLADAEAAFAALQWQMNDSDVSTETFVEDFLRNLDRAYLLDAP